MTKEEAIKVLREIKGGIYRWDDRKYLDTVNMAIESLENDDRETNLMRYALDWKFDEEGNIVLAFDKSFSKFYKDHSIYTVCELLLEPYEPPKYELSQFEYDLLKCFLNGEFASIEDFCSLERMQDKGYFKNIPSDLSIKDILDNCEVIDE